VKMLMTGVSTPVLCSADANRIEWPRCLERECCATSLRPQDFDEVMNDTGTRTTRTIYSDGKH
jgi:hypothetical protein